MGMGTWGLSAFTITDDDLAKICPDTLKAFTDALEAAEIEKDFFHEIASTQDWDYLAENLPEETHEEHSERLTSLYEALQKDFNEKTNMDLFSVFRGEDTGDRYDELDGGSFAVDGVLVESEASKAMKEKYGVETEHKNWTCWG